jgi:hypothetical protein
MGIIFIVKHFKQIAMCVKPQADIAITGVRALNRAVITGICERMANIGFAYAVPENRLFELNFNTQVLNIASMKNEYKAFGLMVSGETSRRRTGGPRTAIVLRKQGN